jgi:hypothetical protein
VRLSLWKRADGEGRAAVERETVYVRLWAVGVRVCLAVDGGGELKQALQGHIEEEGIL